MLSVCVCVCEKKNGTGKQRRLGEPCSGHQRPHWRAAQLDGRRLCRLCAGAVGRVAPPVLIAAPAHTLWPAYLNRLLHGCLGRLFGPGSRSAFGFCFVFFRPRFAFGICFCLGHFFSDSDWTPCARRLSFVSGLLRTWIFIFFFFFILLLLYFL